MKYNGIEIAELVTSHIKNLPREMVVWNDGTTPKVKTIVGTCVNLKGDCWYIAHDDELDIVKFKHCAEIPEETKPRMATNRELSKWLAQGNGEFCNNTNLESCIRNFYTYQPNEANKTAPTYVKIRKFDDDNWHKPDVQYMGIEG